MGRPLFQNHWMDQPDFVDWLRRDSTDVFRSYCRVCQRSFDVKNMGEGAVKSHGPHNRRCRGETCHQHDAIETADTNNEVVILINYIYSSDNQYLVRTRQGC